VCVCVGGGGSNVDLLVLLTPHNICTCSCNDVLTNLVLVFQVHGDHGCCDSSDRSPVV
jgi:hypothetical protein